MKTNHQQTIKHGAVLALAAMALLLVPRPAAAGNWSVNTVPKLVEAINAANQAGGLNTLTLAPGKTFTLTAVNNTTDGPTGLPVIAANNKLTIRGNGATITRSTAPGTPAFRLFEVAAGAALSLKDLTIANGLATGNTVKVTTNKPARLGGSETLLPAGVPVGSGRTDSGREAAFSRKDDGCACEGTAG